MSGLHRLGAGLVHIQMLGRGAADRDRAHQAGVVAPVRPGEFQRELVRIVEPPPPFMTGNRVGIAHVVVHHPTVSVGACAPCVVAAGKVCYGTASI